MLKMCWRQGKTYIFREKEDAMMGNNKWKMYVPLENTPKTQKKTLKNSPNGPKRQNKQNKRINTFISI